MHDFLPILLSTADSTNSEAMVLLDVLLHHIHYSIHFIDVIMNEFVCSNMHALTRNIQMDSAISPISSSAAFPFPAILGVRICVFNLTHNTLL